MITTFMRHVSWLYDRAARSSFWLLLFFLLTSYVWYLVALNALGPSTEYHDPQTPTAVVGPDGRRYVYLGDEFFVTVTVVRHRINGNCRFDITRYAEPVGPPLAGQPPLPISNTDLQFVGNNEMRRIRWPSPPDRYYLGYAVDDNNQPVLSKPLLPDGVDEQEYRFYVVGRYFCNFLDDIFPRYIQGGENPDETPSVRLVVRRHKP